jgi:hypothetical protein
MRKLASAVLLATLTMLFGCDSDTRVKSVEPNFGNVAGNDDVIIVGSGFKPGTVMTVQFGKHEARSVVIDSPSRIRVKTPGGVEGKVDVIVTRDDGKTFVLRDGFLYRRDVASGK